MEEATRTSAIEPKMQKKNSFEANVICILLLSIRMRCETGASNDGMGDEA